MIHMVRHQRVTGNAGRTGHLYLYETYENGNNIKL